MKGHYRQVMARQGQEAMRIEVRQIEVRVDGRNWEAGVLEVAVEQALFEVIADALWALADASMGRWSLVASTLVERNSSVDFSTTVIPSALPCQHQKQILY